MRPEPAVPPRERVLIVEDNPDLRAYAERLLGGSYAVETAEDGAEALEIARRDPPDLVLTDVVMPRLDGFGLLRELRRDERTRAVPVLMLSARAEESSRVEGLESGADDYIVKPFSAKELVARVASNLRLSRARKEMRDALERRVEERTAQLGSALREIESFAYTVAHDLRAPVRAMTGFSQALLEDFGDRLGEEGRDYARRILSAGRRMDGMIGDLLDYSRLSREPIELEETDLEGVVLDVLRDLEGVIAERRGVVDVEKPLPRARAHAPTLRRALENLVANALKFTAEGVEPRVRIRAEGRRLWVEDNGIGIAKEHQERIFGVFERLHRPEAYPGTGIGLAIVRKAMERMGGRAGVESEPGRGSRFYLELPP